MDNTIKDEAVLAHFSSAFTLLSSRLDGVNIFRDDIGDLSIELTFCLTYPMGKVIKLLFTGIREYYFSGGSDYYDYVSEYKLFSNERGFYLSLAPDGTDDTISEDDINMVLALSLTLLL